MRVTIHAAFLVWTGIGFALVSGCNSSSPGQSPAVQPPAATPPPVYVPLKWTANDCKSVFDARKQAVSADKTLEATLSLAAMGCDLSAKKKELKCDEGSADQRCHFALVVPLEPPAGYQGPPPPAAQIIDTSKPEEVTKVCAGISSFLVGAATPASGFAEMAGVAGSYNCETLLRNAGKGDPLVLWSPAAVLNRELVQDAAKTIQGVREGIEKDPVLSALAPKIFIPKLEYDTLRKILDDKKLPTPPLLTPQVDAISKRIDEVARQIPTAIIQGAPSNVPTPTPPALVPVVVACQFLRCGP